MNFPLTLRKIGLDGKQTALYLAALELGESSITELAKKAVLKRPTAYLAIDDLQILGLLSETTKGKRRVFSAVHPRRLLEIARSREKQIEEVLPELLALHNAPKDKPKIQMFEGTEGVRTVYKELYESLSNRKEALLYTNIGALSIVSEEMNEYKKVLRKVKHPRIRELNYGDEKGLQWARDLVPLQGKNHHIRVLPTDFPFGSTDTLILENKFITFSLKKDIFAVVIESIDITQTQRTMFEWAWTQGKEVEV